MYVGRIGLKLMQAGERNPTRGESYVDRRARASDLVPADESYAGIGTFGAPKRRATCGGRHAHQRGRWEPLVRRIMRTLSQRSCTSAMGRKRTSQDYLRRPQRAEIRSTAAHGSFAAALTAANELFANERWWTHLGSNQGPAD
jgi:hypothetical protein